MKKLLLLVICLFTLLLSCNKKEEINETLNVNDVTYKIGITQIVTHPSLDLVKEGFKKAFEEAGIKADFDEKNAEGTIANANLIANNFKADQKDLVLGIATPSAQALVNNITDIPVLFSAVTDPVSANILTANSTGTSDKVDAVSEQLDLLLQLNPDAKSIGILYNTSEQNSVIQVQEIEEIAKAKNLNVVLRGITAFSELAQATKSLLLEVDAIYVPTDNLVVSGIQLVNDAALESNKIVIASENSSVEAGALFTLGLDYFELGKRTGEMAIEILNGKPISELPFETSSKKQLYINKVTLEKLGYDINNPLFKDAVIYE